MMTKKELLKNMNLALIIPISYAYFNPHTFLKTFSKPTSSRADLVIVIYWLHAAATCQ